MGANAGGVLDELESTTEAESRGAWERLVGMMKKGEGEGGGEIQLRITND